MSVKSNYADMLIYNIPKNLLISTLNTENKQKNKFLTAYRIQGVNAYISQYIKYSSDMFIGIATGLKCSNKEF